MERPDGCVRILPQQHAVRDGNRPGVGNQVRPDGVTQSNRDFRVVRGGFGILNLGLDDDFLVCNVLKLLVGRGNSTLVVLNGIAREQLETRAAAVAFMGDRGIRVRGELRPQVRVAVIQVVVKDDEFLAGDGQYIGGSIG